MLGQQKNSDPSRIEPGNITRYCIGFVLGLLPAIMFILGLKFVAPSTFLVLAGLLVLVEILVMVICLASRGARSYGYGLLTALLITPIVIVIGCSVLQAPIGIHGYYNPISVTQTVSALTATPTRMMAPTWTANPIQTVTPTP